MSTIFQKSNVSTMMLSFALLLSSMMTLSCRQSGSSLSADLGSTGSAAQTNGATTDETQNASPIAEGSIEARHLATMGASNNQVLTYSSSTGWSPQSLDLKIGSLEAGKLCKANSEGTKVECTYESSSDTDYGGITVTPTQTKIPWDTATILANQGKSYQWTSTGGISLQPKTYCGNGPHPHAQVTGSSDPNYRWNLFRVTFGKVRVDGSDYPIIVGSFSGQQLYAQKEDGTLIPGLDNVFSTGSVQYTLLYFQDRWHVYRLHGQADTTLFACR